MKKIIALLMTASLFLFSCKKDHATLNTPAGKKYPVTFNVTNFTQQKGAFSVSGKKLAVNDVLQNINGYLDVLYYYVYDTNNNFVHRIVQDSTMSNLGTVTDSLPQGTYTIDIVAGKKGLTGTNNTSNIETSITYGSDDWQDTFLYQAINYTVGTTSNNTDVTMHRIVTELALQLTDTVPANASTITIAVYPEYPTYLLDNNVQTGTPDTLKTVITIPDAWKGQPGFMYNKIYGYGGQSTGYDVELTAHDASNHILGSAHIPNVMSGQGQKTTLSGKLFTNPSGGTAQSQNFTVQVDTAWNAINQVGFSLRH